jgi:branched-chain amino acid transport system permease protein
MFAQLLVSGVVVGSLYALVALGMTILYRSTTVVNFAQGEFFMLGAFAVLVAQQQFGLNYVESIVFSLALLFCVGALVDKVLMRPLQLAPHVSLAMMTVALSYLMKGVARFFSGREVKPLAPLLDGDPIGVGDITLLPQEALILVFTIVVVIGFFLFFRLTRAGKMIQAASQTPRGAALVGINVPLLRNVMWGMGALMGAAAGILIAPTTLVYPDMGASMLMHAFAAMTLGGFGSLPGAVLGGVTLGIVQNLFGGFVSSSLIDVTDYLVIIAVLIVRPQGLLGGWGMQRG